MDETEGVTTSPVRLRKKVLPATLNLKSYTSIPEPAVALPAAHRDNPHPHPHPPPKGVGSLLQPTPPL